MNWEGFHQGVKTKSCAPGEVEGSVSRLAAHVSEEGKHCCSMIASMVEIVGQNAPERWGTSEKPEKKIL